MEKGPIREEDNVDDEYTEKRREDKMREEKGEKKRIYKRPEQYNMNKQRR